MLEQVNFKLSVSANHIEIEPGASKPLFFDLINNSTEPEEFEISIEGLDHQWINIPNHTLNIESHGSSAEKIIIHLPRTSESLAGLYPFALRVKSKKTGAKQSAEIVLEIKPFAHISLDVLPKKGTVSPLKKSFEYQVQLTNLGNEDQTLQLHAHGADDLFTFQFQEEKVSLGAGQQKTISLTAGLTKRRFLGNSQLSGVSIFARSVQSKATVATSQVQLERRTLASPAAFAVTLTFLLLAIGWIAMIPKPPTMLRFALSKPESLRGEIVRLSWRASDADSVQIQKNGKVLFDHLDPKGEVDYTPSESGQFEISAIAMSGRKQSESKVQYLVVKDPEPVPLPEILAFDINPKQLHVGQTIVVKYAFNDAVVKATLSPPGITLNTKIHEIELTATRPGEITYNLVAENSTGLTASKKIKLMVTEASNASIVVFKAIPDNSEGSTNKVLLVWQLSNAVRAEIRTESGFVVQVNHESGSKALHLTKPETLTLIGYDQQGKTVEKRLHINYQEATEHEGET